MEIKPQNLSKMSNEQLYHLVVQKEISDTDRTLVKNELVKREAETLYNQAKRARPGEITPILTGMVAKAQTPRQAQGAKKKQIIKLLQYGVLIIIAFVLVAVVYAAIVH